MASTSAMMCKMPPVAEWSRAPWLEVDFISFIKLMIMNDDEQKAMRKARKKKTVIGN